MKNIIIYDFDGTLTPYSMPRFKILEKCGFENGADNSEFINLVKKTMQEKNMDMVDACYEVLLEQTKQAGFELTDTTLSLGYNKVDYNKGVNEFLDMLNKNNIKNYLLSSGMKIYLEKINICKYFKYIYATTFNYDENGKIINTKFLMNEKNKVFAIKEIMKENDEINCSNIIYIGDGLTDYYAMEYVKSNGGTTIFVYKDEDDKAVIEMKKMGIVDLYTQNDFSQDSELSKYIRKLCLK